MVLFLNISGLIDEIKASKKYENQIVHIENISQRKAIYKEIELEPLIKFALSEKGIEKLYSHQAETIEYLRNGENVVLSTGTASGKSMAYMIPIFEEIIKNPYSTAIYISPLNALINDQLKNFIHFRNTMGIEVNINKYTGKMSAEERRTVKYGNPQIIFTNPEMLHGSILGWNKQWNKFLSNLRLVVIDESHYYRGVIGSNMANILRRFNRICDFYGSSPRYICCSATIGNPLEHSATLTGKKLKVVINNGSSSGEQKFVFWNPPHYVNRQGFTDRKSSLTESTELFATFVQKGLQTIAFTKARQKVEKMYKITQNELNKRGANAKIMPYRSGYLSEERETIEKQLSESVIQGVISTNALELGIDIGNLDACILDGYPGTVMSTRQRAGRAGRSENESIVVLVAGSDALDQYYMRNPSEFFNRSPEAAVLNVYNKHIQMGHILCAAKEIPLTKKDIHYFGEDFLEVLEALEAENLLEGDEKKICLDKNAHMLVSIRSADRNNYTMLLEGSKFHKIEDGIERSQAYRECFEGSVYFHIGTSYIVKKVDHDKKLIYVAEDSSDYYTRPKINSEISIVDVFDKKDLFSGSEIKVGFGSVDVNEQVVGYKKFQYFTDKEMDEEILSMPPYRLDTEAMWLELPDSFKEMVENSNRDFEGGIHAIEHAMIGIYPLHLLVDRNDLGGVSTSEYTEFNGKGSIFIYDGHRGGVGYAESGYEGIVELLKATLKSIEECPCKDGCPSCIQSPKCGNNNNPLDKDAARMILHEMLGLPKYIPFESEKKKVLENSPNSKRIESTKNDRNVSKNDAEDVLNRARRKLKIHERKSVEEWIKLGQTTESHNIAYKYFEMALKKEPENPDALFNIGIASLNRKSYRKALENFNKMIDLGYSDWEVWTYKGIALDYLQHYNEAIEAYEEALKTKKDDPEILEYKISAERQLERPNVGISTDIIVTYTAQKKSYFFDDIRKDYPNAYMPWEESEELKLIELYKSGTKIKEIATILGRKEGGVRSRLKKLNIL